MGREGEGEWRCLVQMERRRGGAIAGVWGGEDCGYRAGIMGGSPLEVAMFCQKIHGQIQGRGGWGGTVGEEFFDIFAQHVPF